MMLSPDSDVSWGGDKEEGRTRADAHKSVGGLLADF